MIGTININNSGYAFVTIDNYNIIIPNNKRNNALPGDKVKIRITNTNKGQVLEIIERNKKKYVGKLNIFNNFVFVNQLNTNVFIPKIFLKNACHNDKVIINITNWPNNSNYPYGKIIEILGKTGKYKTEIYAILAELGIYTYHNFPKKVEDEAKNIISNISWQNEINSRIDMRDVNTFTIDPIDAKDFDDAISLRKLPNNNWELGIHIADVTFFVKKNSFLDKEAYKRANSIYLINHVIPMLPEILSNKFCSLRQNEDKLSFSVIFEINDNAQILKSWFGKTIIRSNKQFSYEEVQKIIYYKKGLFKKEILKLNSFTKILRKKRLKNGSFYFNKSEIKFLLEKNNPIKLYMEYNNDSYNLIEELMLLANKKVSEFISLNKKNQPLKRTYIYRIHDKPNFEKIIILKQILKNLGLTLNIKNNKTINDSVIKIINDIKNYEENNRNFIETLIIRAMSKAKYSTNNIGHYGLSFNYYSHFTSPIRRYSDIIAHRLLEHYLNNGQSVSINHYEKQSIHCSERERLAINAERIYIKYMQLKYMQKFIGKKLEGIISGITEWGIYIQILLSYTEGLIKLRDIKDDKYIFDPINYNILGLNKGNIFFIGQKIIVKIVSADFEKKKLKLSIDN
ncbi:MAG: VacB/RNase II family 3'-5' exoribonuclease [Candidatus Bostrichicola ureolyticus]|nr:MAG: VacB/RNase II family 3'-5' exoribonuclease [Candidatus Bostrichicola ureolyticus]